MWYYIVVFKAYLRLVGICRRNFRWNCGLLELAEGGASACESDCDQRKIRGADVTEKSFQEETQMGKKKFTRIVSMMMALLLLVSSAAIAVSASSSSVTDKSIKDYISMSGVVTYDEYRAQKFTDRVKAADTVLTFDATQNWVFESTNGDVVGIVNGVWTLTTTIKDAESGEDVQKTLTQAEVEAEGSGYDINDYVHLKTVDGKTGLYTPPLGSVTWTLDLVASGLTEAAIFNISTDYYPVVNKTASIEREFYINGEVPFIEARSLTLPKRWSSYMSDGETILTADVTPDKKLVKKEGSAEAALDKIFNAATEAGLTAEKTEQGTVQIKQPSVTTQKISKFLDEYGVRFFVTDKLNNELRPIMKQDPEWMTYTLQDSSGYYSEPLGFVLEPDDDGFVKFTLKGINEPVVISQITLSPYTTYQTYDEYLKGVQQTLGTTNIPAGQDTVKVEAEYTVHTSTSSVYPVEDRSEALNSPSDTSRTVLNTIGTEKWQTAGQWIEYKFSVESSGMYDIFARFRQNVLDGMYVCRSMKIFSTDSDGSEFSSPYDYNKKYGNTAGYYDGIPFEEASRLRFDYNDAWQVKGLTDGGADADSYPLYFEAGVVYTIQLEVTLGSMSEIVRQIESILNDLNDDYLNIIKLTGSSPDTYRDYSFFRLLPETMSNMILQAGELEALSNSLKNHTAGSASSYTGICDKLSALLLKMGEDENAIAQNLSNFKSYVGSLGTFLTDAKTQPLQLDYLSIQGAGTEAPAAKAGFFKAFTHEISSFFMSFIRDYNSMGAMDDVDVSDKEPISVWLAYGRDQSQVIRNLCTNDFTGPTGIPVDLKLISGGTLLPSILAGMGPDAYLGLAQGEVINYAIRGALMNVEGMDGFDEVTKNFNEAAMIVLGIADSDGDMHYYGLPETQGFNMMFVRTDILGDLGIEIPKTWEEIYIAQSKLESNNMEIGLANDYQIFLYQMNGELFADDGMRINLDSEVALEAFDTMCNMFTQYSFPYQYDAANRFRTGEMPIIISNYTSLYNHLKVFATELEGAWTFVPLPGYEQEDGTINNCAVSSCSAVVMVREDGKDYSDAWTFVKWYTDAPCQAEYANEMVAILGDSAKHSTANKEALENMPWTYEEFIEVSKQFENLASIPNYPGAYIIGRYTEFAFLAAYNSDADPRTEILSYINTINKEITRKREEFKLETLEIGQTLVEKREEQIEKAFAVLEEKFNGATEYKELIAATRFAYVNEEINQIQECSDRFMAALEGKHDGSTITIQKVSGATMEVPSYYINVSRQTAEPKNGGYKIDSLNEQQLLYFISVSLSDVANALTEYNA